MAQTNRKITIVGLNYAPEPTGIAPYTTGLAQGLASQKWDVRVVTSFPHYPAWQIAEGYSGRRMTEKIEGVVVTRLRPFMPKNPSGVARLLFELNFGLKSILTRWDKPEIVILVSPALFSVAIALVKARLSPQRPRVLIWVQDLYGLGVTETGALGGAGGRLMSAVESRLLRHADAVVAIHDRFKRHMVSRLGVRGERVSVVRNWTHLAPMLVDRDVYREKFGWGDEVVVLHAGNMGAKQALDNVVDAAILAETTNANVRFVLLGNGNQREKIQSLGRHAKRLQFMDSLSDHDFLGALAAADILLVNEKPGVTEMAVPSKLTSYFASRRPVIAATDAGSITAEEIEAAGAGVRVDAGDPAALVKAAVDLGADRVRAKRFGENGALFQEKVLSTNGAISHYAEILNSLAGKGGR